MPDPEYARIASELASEIESGVWRPGATLPTIPELEQRFQVSRITVRGALDSLSQQGMVYTGYVDGRRGTIVRPQGRTLHRATDALKPTRERSEYDAFSESAQDAGRTPSKRFDMNIAVPPHDVAERLGVADDDLVVVRKTIQVLDDEPWAVETSYFPRDLASAAGIDTPHDIERGTIRALSEAGYRETAYVDEISDETANSSHAPDLAVPAGYPLLVQIRTAATTERVTRVTTYHRLGKRNRLVWEIGDEAGISVIRRTRTNQDAECG